MEWRPPRGKRLIKEARVYVEEIQNRILRRFPDATFKTYHSYVPEEGIYIDAYVDTEDESEIFDLVNDRALDILIEKKIPIHVIPFHSSDLGKWTAPPAHGQPQGESQKEAEGD